MDPSFEFMELTDKFQSRASGDANFYWIFPPKNQKWFAHIHLNGEMRLEQQENHIKSLVNSLNNEAKSDKIKQILLKLKDHQINKMENAGGITENLINEALKLIDE